MKKFLTRLAFLFVIFLVIGYSTPTNFYDYFAKMKPHQTKFVDCKMVEKNCQRIPWYLGLSKGSVQYRCDQNVHVRKYGNKCIAHKDYYDPRTLGGALNHIWYDFLKV